MVTLIIKITANERTSETHCDATGDKPTQREKDMSKYVVDNLSTLLDTYAEKCGGQVVDETVFRAHQSKN